MSLIGKLRDMALSPDQRVQAVRELLRDRCAELARTEHVVVSSDIDEGLVRQAGGGLPSWVIYYKADPDLRGLVHLEIDSYRSGERMVLEPAYANLLEGDEPYPHLLIADLQVIDVRRRHRSIGTRLVEAAKTVASQRGLPLTGNLSDVDDVEMLVSFYHQLGFETRLYEESEAHFAGEIKWTPPATDPR